MSLTITATVGSETANSFVTLAEFQTYLATRVDAVACEVSAYDRQKALVFAGKELNRKPWRGVKADDDQSMAWPRRYVPIPDGNDYFESDAIPQAVKDAQCEIALSVLAATALTQSGAATGAIRSFSQGDVSITYDVSRKPAGTVTTTENEVNRLLYGLVSSGKRLMRA